MKQSRLRQVSPKRAVQLRKLNQLTERLRYLCGNRSELSGLHPDWKSSWKVDPHHIKGRIGKLLLDPFNIIMLVRDEHMVEEDHMKGKRVGKEKLLEIVKEKRLRQGFVQDY